MLQWRWTCFSKSIKNEDRMNRMNQLTNKVKIMWRELDWIPRDSFWKRAKQSFWKRAYRTMPDYDHKKQVIINSNPVTSTYKQNNSKQIITHHETSLSLFTTSSSLSFSRQKKLQTTQHTSPHYFHKPFDSSPIIPSVYLPSPDD